MFDLTYASESFQPRVIYVTQFIFECPNEPTGVVGFVGLYLYLLVKNKEVVFL